MREFNPVPESQFRKAYDFFRRRLRDRDALLCNEEQRVYDDLWLPMQNRLRPSLTEFMLHFLGSEGEEVRKVMFTPPSNASLPIQRGRRYAFL
jgi:hypothetical protein